MTIEEFKAECKKRNFTPSLTLDFCVINGVHVYTYGPLASRFEVLLKAEVLTKIPKPVLPSPLGQKVRERHEYLGNGTYKHLAPVITEKGRELGWRYEYPVQLNLCGVNYSNFTTLDALEAEGIIKLVRCGWTAHC